MTPRGERRHYLSKACSTSDGCQKSNKNNNFYIIEP